VKQTKLVKHEQAFCQVLLPLTQPLADGVVATSNRTLSLLDAASAAALRAGVPVEL
jgi:hypothetical protein